MSRLPVSQLSFADLQLQSLGVHLDPTLRRVADFLEEHTSLIELVRKDLERGLKSPTAGRHGITPAQTLRSLVLMRVKNWDYRDLRERINDGFTLRTFTLFDSGPESVNPRGRALGSGVKAAWCVAIWLMRRDTLAG